jgi:superfamily I DNA/RNA helicase
MPQKLQALAKLLLEQPTHKGVAAFLKKLHDLKASDPAFTSLEIDYPREFWDAVHLERFESAADGLSEITRRRTYARPKLPARAISTIHKAKGHECDHVIVMPCDAQHFPDKPGTRCLLYVAMSRATDSLTLIVSRTNPSPLLELP